MFFFMIESYIYNSLYWIFGKITLVSNKVFVIFLIYWELTNYRTGEQKRFCSYKNIQYFKQLKRYKKYLLEIRVEYIET